MSEWNAYSKLDSPFLTARYCRHFVILAVKRNIQPQPGLV